MAPRTHVALRGAGRRARTVTALVFLSLAIACVDAACAGVGCKDKAVSLGARLLPNSTDAWLAADNAACKSSVFPQTGSLVPIRMGPLRVSETVWLEWPATNSTPARELSVLLTTSSSTYLEGPAWASSEPGRVPSWRDLSGALRAAVPEEERAALPTSVPVVAVVAAAAQRGWAWDNGTLPQRPSPPPSGGSAPAPSPAFAPARARRDVLLQGRNGWHWTSQDAGESWTAVRAPGAGGGAGDAIRPHPRREGWYLALAERWACPAASARLCPRDLFVTHDHGVSWRNATETSDGFLADVVDARWAAELRALGGVPAPDEAVVAVSRIGAPLVGGVRSALVDPVVKRLGKEDAEEAKTVHGALATLYPGTPAGEQAEAEANGNGNHETNYSAEAPSSSSPFSNGSSSFPPSSSSSSSNGILASHALSQHALPLHSLPLHSLAHLGAHGSGDGANGSSSSASSSASSSSSSSSSGEPSVYHPDVHSNTSNAFAHAAAATVQGLEHGPAGDEASRAAMLSRLSVVGASLSSTFVRRPAPGQLPIAEAASSLGASGLSALPRSPFARGATYPGWESDRHLVVSTDGFASAPGRLGERGARLTLAVPCAEGMDVAAGLLRAAVPVGCPLDAAGRPSRFPEPAGAQGSARVRLVALDPAGELAEEACFPTAPEADAYSSLVSQDGAAAAVLAHRAAPGSPSALFDGPVADLYWPGHGGRFGSLSLSGVHRRGARADVHRVEALDGTYLANVASGAARPGERSLAHWALRSLRSADGGASWEPLEPPAVFRHAVCAGCDSGSESDPEACSLHLYGAAAEQGRRGSRPAPASASGAPGLIVAVGNAGPRLDSSRGLCTWTSSDGGATWTDVAPEPTVFAVGARGGALLAGKHASSGPTDTLLLSLDHGGCWHKVTLPEPLLLSGLSTAPGGEGFRFVAHGTACLRTPATPTCTDAAGGAPEGVAVAFDVRDLLGGQLRVCGKGDSPSGLEAWISPDGCTLGARRTFSRRKPDAGCLLNGTDAVQLAPELAVCRCAGDRDLECEYGTVRAGAEGFAFSSWESEAERALGLASTYYANDTRAWIAALDGWRLWGATAAKRKAKKTAGGSEGDGDWDAPSSSAPSDSALALASPTKHRRLSALQPKRVDAGLGDTSLSLAALVTSNVRWEDSGKAGRLMGSRAPAGDADGSPDPASPGAQGVHSRVVLADDLASAAAASRSRRGRRVAAEGSPDPILSARTVRHPPGMPLCRPLPPEALAICPSWRRGVGVPGTYAASETGYRLVHNDVCQGVEELIPDTDGRGNAAGGGGGGGGGGGDPDAPSAGFAGLGKVFAVVVGALLLAGVGLFVERASRQGSSGPSEVVAVARERLAAAGTAVVAGAWSTIDAARDGLETLKGRLRGRQTAEGYAPGVGVGYFEPLEETSDGTESAAPVLFPDDYRQP